ncbi:MAG: Hsp70 family protein [Bdellovibrionota bacterium]
MAWSYTIGIDLGTSNSALTWQKSGNEKIHLLEIEQIQTASAISRQNTLPSVIYFPNNTEATTQIPCLPWQSNTSNELIVGEWAKNRCHEAPDRCVVSAKSWLCNNKVQRDDQILPWKSQATSKRISPIEASTLYLKHLMDCFSYQRLEQDNEEIDWNDVHVTLTIPASFDDVARSLTVKAAKDAGIVNLNLLEEPQAAFYSWIKEKDKQWRKNIEAGDVILVIDIGGGTSDFSLISVHEKEGNLELERICVGDHLLLGGDNMDLALAYSIQDKLENEGTNIDTWQFQSLVSSCRHAKEKILSNQSLENCPITIASRGSSLFSGSISTKLDKTTLLDIFTNGFFPKCSMNDKPNKSISSGLSELGLDYAEDAAITKHLANFLTKSSTNIEASSELKKQIDPQRYTNDNKTIMPNKILFNGGVFNASILKQHIMDIFRGWANNEKIEELISNNLNHAVAIGASYFGSLKNANEKLRVRSGLNRSYYLGLAEAGMAVPGRKPKIKAICIAPQGSEEGVPLEKINKSFGLMTDEKVEFRFFSSSSRAGDQVGSEVADACNNLEESAKLSTFLSLNSHDIDSSVEKGEIVPVSLDAKITDIGTLHLSLKHQTSNKQWDLEFNIRAHN